MAPAIGISATRSAKRVGLYNQIDIDWGVEKHFGRYKMNEDDNVSFYFKFPPAFKIDISRIIVDYNLDWSIACYQDDKILLELER